LRDGPGTGSEVQRNRRSACVSRHRQVQVLRDELEFRVGHRGRADVIDFFEIS
jgi:hypothetical protein